MAKFENGHKKAGGRKTGTPNRRTLNFIDRLEELNLDPLAELVDVLPELPPERKASVLLDLISYLWPKRKALEVESSSQMTDDEAFAIWEKCKSEK